MAGPEVARAEDVWRRSYPLWEAYFAMVLVGTIAVTSVDEVSPGRRVAAIGLLVLLSVAYVAAGGRSGLRALDGWWPEGRVFAGLLIVLFVPATLLAPVSAMGLAGLAPMIYMMYETWRGLVMTAVLFSGPAGLVLTAAGSGAAVVVVVLGVTLACSALLAVSIGRLGAQNRERARLIEELDRTRDELARVSREAGVRAERERLAGDIHDTIAQGLTSIGMLLQAAQAEGATSRYLELAARTAKENLAETRGLVAALAPPVLDGCSLADALRRLAHDFELPVDVRVEGEPRPLGTVEVTLLRVMQESLANIRKHAGAQTVRVELVYGDAVRLTIVDDGCGFDPGAVTSGFGLRGMRGRVEQAGGMFEIRRLEDGTEVAVEVPCSG